MMINRSRLKGTVFLPPSKSELHRLLICAALSDGKSQISGVSMSDDIEATVNGLSALGAKFCLRDSVMTVTGLIPPERASVNCMESGSTLRFLMPVCAALGIGTKFSGCGRLPKRPLDEYFRVFKEHGVKISADKLPFEISGKLTPGTYKVSGNISSQYITGLLFALTLLDGDSEIILTSPLESSGYIDLTLSVLEQFSVKIQKTAAGYTIVGNQNYRSCNLSAEGDWSQAAFFMLAGALGGEIILKNLKETSRQGDKACADIFRNMGARILNTDGDIVCAPGKLRAIKLDASDVPDLVPAVAAAAAMAEGTTEIIGASRLRLKESDRICSVVNALTAMGFSAKERPDGMTIYGTGGKCPALQCASVDTAGDHRIAMAFSVLAAFMPFPTEIKGHTCVRKSYPDFYEVFKTLGGEC